MSVRRDYKPDPHWNKRRKVRRHGVLVIVLVIIGAAGALAAYVSRDTALPDAGVVRQGDIPPRQDTRAVRQSESVEIPLPKPKYDFYSVLPEREIEIPDDDVSPSQPRNVSNKPAAQPKPENPEASAASSDRKADTKSAYIIQAGSFSSYADADRTKASLALLGIRAHIESAAGSHSTTVHRVRIGPIKDPRQLRELRQRLQANDIPSIAIRSD